MRFDFPEVRDRLKLAVDQLKVIRSANESHNVVSRKIAAKKKMSAEEKSKQFLEVREAGMKTIIDSLSDEQKATWKELKGEPLKKVE